MKQKLFSILALLLMSVTGAWAQEESLLTTITPDYRNFATYTVADIAEVSGSNVDASWDPKSDDYWMNASSTAKGQLTVTGKEGYTITRVVFTVMEDPYSGSTRTKEYTEAPYAVYPYWAEIFPTQADQDARTNGLGYGVTKIEVYGYANTPATVNVTANEGASGEYWSTFYNASQGYTADANTTIYKGSLSGSSLQLTAVTDIAAGQAVILKSTAASITLTPAATTSSDFTGNDLKGGTEVTSGYDAYTLSRGGEGTGTVGFYKFSGSLDGSKAHLEVVESASTRSFIGFGDGTTAIEAPAATTSAEDGEWYSLDGRRLSGKPARKGIYVRNGQKFIIK